MPYILVYISGPQSAFFAAISILSPCFYTSKIRAFLQPALLPFLADPLSSTHSLLVSKSFPAVSYLLGYHFHRISASLTKFQASFTFRAISTFLNWSPSDLKVWPFKLTTACFLQLFCLKRIYSGRHELLLLLKDTIGFLITGVPGFPEQCCSRGKPDHSSQLRCPRNCPLPLHYSYQLSKGTSLFYTQAEGC